MPDRKLAASSLGIDWLPAGLATLHSVPPRSQNFYGSARSPHFVDKLTRMQRRYEEAFGGPGAVVYKLGHSEALAKVRSHPLLARALRCSCVSVAFLPPLLRQALPALLVLDRGPLVVTPPPPLAPGTASVVLEESIDGALFM